MSDGTPSRPSHGATSPVRSSAVVSNSPAVPVHT